MLDDGSSCQCKMNSWESPTSAPSAKKPEFSVLFDQFSTGFLSFLCRMDPTNEFKHHCNADFRHGTVVYFQKSPLWHVWLVPGHCSAPGRTSRYMRENGNPMKLVYSKYKVLHRLWLKMWKSCIVPIITSKISYLRCELRICAMIVSHYVLCAVVWQSRSLPRILCSCHVYNLCMVQCENSLEIFLFGKSGVP